MLSQLNRLGEEVLSQNEEGIGFEIGLSLTEKYYRYYFSHVELSRALLKEIIWDLDYYHTFNQTLFQSISHNMVSIEKMPLLLDCYFMTLITHLSRVEPDVELALKELNIKYENIMNE